MDEAKYGIQWAEPIIFPSGKKIKTPAVHGAEIQTGNDAANRCENAEYRLFIPAVLPQNGKQIARSGKDKPVQQRKECLFPGIPQETCEDVQGKNTAGYRPAAENTKASTRSARGFIRIFVRKANRRKNSPENLRISAQKNSARFSRTSGLRPRNYTSRTGITSRKSPNKKLIQRRFKPRLR